MKRMTHEARDEVSWKAFLTMNLVASPSPQPFPEGAGVAYHPKKRCFPALLAAVWVGMGLALTGCLGWRPAPVDFNDPAWSVRRGQAVWHPAGRDIELAGEWLGATADEGRGYVQFNKSPMLVAEVRVEAGRWMASFPFLRRRYQGVGSPPGRLVWAQWIRVAQGRAPGEGWFFSGDLSGAWRLAHERTGEWLEGVGEP